MEDMKSEHVFALHRKTAELLDDLKQVRLGGGVRLGGIGMVRREITAARGTGVDRFSPNGGL